MTIQYNENIKIAAPNPIDKRYLSNRVYCGSHLPYSACTEVNTTIISSERYTGLTVNIGGKEHWYKTGVLDTCLVEKKYDTLIPQGNYVTGGTNIGAFSGVSGVQQLCVIPFSTLGANYLDYQGNYCSIYNNYYRGTDGKVHVGTSTDGIAKRGYVKNETPAKSFIWNEYVGSSNLLGWILIDGCIQSQIGQFEIGCTYYTNSSEVFMNTSWSAPLSKGKLTVSSVNGSLSTGSTLAIGGPVYAKTLNNLIYDRTIKSKTPDYINISYDEAFIYLSGTTAVVNGQNVGGGYQVYSQKSGSTLQFRTLVGSGGTTIVQNSDSITIFSSTSGGGTGTITAAINGVRILSDGATIALGGNLTSGTTINGVGLYGLTLANINNFNACDSFNNSRIYYTTNCTQTQFSNSYAKLTSTSASIANNNNVVCANSTGVMLSTTGGTVNLSTTLSEGLFYGGNYYSTNTCWIPTKYYVDSIAVGLKLRDSVAVATTGNTTLSGLTIVDSIQTTAGMRVLVKNQTNSVYNGIYSASTGTWGRTDDYNFIPSGEISNGDLIPVTSGATQYNSLWAVTTPNPIVSGDTLTFTLFNLPNAYLSGTGIDISLNTISVDGSSLAGNSITWSGDTFNVNPYTGTLSTALNSKVNTTTYSTYTGNTNTRIGNIETIYVTGGTNGISCSGHQVCLGGALTNTNTCIVSTNSLSCAYLNFNKTSSTITTCTKGGDIIFGSSALSGSGGKICVITVSGMTYSTDNSAYYTNRSIVDKEYVDRRLNNVSVRFTDSNPFYLTCSDEYIGVTGYTAFDCACIYLLPSPNVQTGQKVIISDIQGGSLTYPVTVDGNGNCINGLSNGCAFINTDYGSITFIYNGLFWSATAFVN